MEKSKGLCYGCGEEKELKPFGDFFLCSPCLKDVEKNYREDLYQEIREIAETFSLKEKI